MEKESKLGLMALNMKDFINLEKNQERESYYLLTKVFMKEILLIMRYKAKVSILGMMEKSMRVVGRIIK